MRKILEPIALAALAVLILITFRALYGPNRLPDSIPTHFDLAGRPDGWGSPLTLILLPAMGLFVYLLMTVVARFPSAFNYPVRVTSENRPRLQTVAIRMILWLKAELVCLFGWLQWSTIHAARHPGESLSAAHFMAPVSILLVFGTIGWHFVAMRRAAKPGYDS